MKNYASGKRRSKFCCFLVLGLILMACQQGGSNSTASPQGEGDSTNVELCRKYEACGCEKFTKCMQEAASAPDLQKPGVRECMLKSSCQSLCAGHPDGCLSNPGGGSQGAGTAPRQTNCAGIPCSKNSDCPVGCTGGCGDMGYCLSF